MTEATETTAAATEAAPAKDSRIVVLKSVPVKVNHPVDLSEESLKKLATGKTKEQPRAEFIREYWKLGYSRSDITKLARAFGQDPEMKYQIVFQATKGVEGGPAPKAEAATEGAAVEGTEGAAAE